MESHEQNNLDGLDFGTSSLYNDICPGPSSPTSRFLICNYDSNITGREDPPPYSSLGQIDSYIETVYNPLSDNDRPSDLLPLTFPLPLSGPQTSGASYSLSDLSLSPSCDNNYTFPNSLDENLAEFNLGMTTQLSPSPHYDRYCTPTCELQKCNPMSRKQRCIYFKRVVSICRRRRRCCGILMYGRLRNDLGY